MKMSWFAAALFIFFSPSSFAERVCVYSTGNPVPTCTDSAQPNSSNSSNCSLAEIVNGTCGSSTAYQPSSDRNQNQSVVVPNQSLQNFYNAVSGTSSYSGTTHSPQYSSTQVSSQSRATTVDQNTRYGNCTFFDAVNGNCNTPPSSGNAYHVNNHAVNNTANGNATNPNGSTNTSPENSAAAQEALRNFYNSVSGKPPSKPKIIAPIPVPPANLEPSSNLPPTSTSEAAVTAPAPGGNVAPFDVGQVYLMKPKIPTESIKQKLEGYCPDCADAAAKAYQAKFASFHDINDQLAGSMLKTAAHNMMKIVHMNCEADKMFVPTDYVTNLEYCGGAEKCDRLGPAPKTYYPDDIEKFKRNEQNMGDFYRAPISNEVAQTRVSNSKNDQRTCQDLYDRPAIFDVGGHSSFSKNSMDPFNYKAQAGLTGGSVNLADCSSTMNTIFAAAGLKFSAKDTSYGSAYSKSTAALVSLAYAGQKDQSSCLSIPQFNDDDSIHSGDMFVIHRQVNGKREDMGHVLMFDDVKEDPFNLAGVTKESECKLNSPDSKILPNQFRFSIVQSSGTTVDRQVFERFKGIDLSVEEHYDDLGPADSKPCGNYAQPSTCDMRARFEDWGAHILQMAQKACLAKVTHKPQKPVELIQSRNPALVNDQPVTADTAGVLIRHKGPTPACTFAQPPEIVGAKCVAGCLNK